MNRIITCGIYRSGSTWLFNAVRLILKSVFPKTIGYFYPDMHLELENSLEDFDFTVIKVHGFYQELLDSKLIICSRRNLLDIAASSVRYGMTRQNSHELNQLCRNNVIAPFNHWSSKCHFIMDYEDMYANKEFMIRKLSNLLNVKCDAVTINGEIESLKLPDDPGYNGNMILNQYDSISLLNRRHITDGVPKSYEKILTRESIEFINNNFGAWMQENGFDR